MRITQLPYILYAFMLIAGNSTRERGSWFIGYECTGSTLASRPRPTQASNASQASNCGRCHTNSSLCIATLEQACAQECVMYCIQEARRQRRGRCCRMDDNGRLCKLHEGATARYNNDDDSWLFDGATPAPTKPPTKAMTCGHCGENQTCYRGQCRY